MSDHHGARSAAAATLYGQYHEALLQGERQAGKMLSGMVGIAERVSPNEIDPASIYSIYHRTVEWTKKKEIGVVIVNTFSSRGKELIRLRVASSDLCAYNAQKMRVRQQMTQIDSELYELLFLMRIPTVQLHHRHPALVRGDREGREHAPSPWRATRCPATPTRWSSTPTATSPRWWRTSTPSASSWRRSLALLTPSPTTPHTYVPHGLDPSDPLYINPVGTYAHCHA